jgi:hypothetical protein
MVSIQWNEPPGSGHARMMKPYLTLGWPRFVRGAVRGPVRFLTLFIILFKARRCTGLARQPPQAAADCGGGGAQTMVPAADAIRGHRSAHSLATGPVMAEPFISPLGFTITPERERHAVRTYAQVVPTVMLMARCTCFAKLLASSERIKRGCELGKNERSYPRCPQSRGRDHPFAGSSCVA